MVKTGSTNPPPPPSLGVLETSSSLPWATSLLKNLQWLPIAFSVEPLRSLVF